MKKNFFYSLLLTFFCAQTQLVFAPDSTLDWENADTDFFNPENSARFIDIFDDDDPFLDDFLSTPVNITRQFTPKEIIEFLKHINGIELLQEEFFLRTTPLNKQSLLDMPLLGDAQCANEKKHVFGFDLFYNQTSRSNLAPDSTKISSYLALQKGSLIGKLQQIVDQIAGDNPLSPAFNIDIQKVFNLFENMTVQERRLGSMLFWIQKWRNIIGHFRIPLYYLERNFWLNKDEQQAVEEEFGALEPEEQERFQKAHFISDKFGFGDARIEIETPVLEGPRHQVNFGGQVTIPTAFSIAKGMKGSTFDRPSTFPVIDFDKLLELAEKGDSDSQEQIFNTLSNFALCSLDRIAANLLDAKLGNDRHFGLGPFVRTQVPLSLFTKHHWATDINWSNKISIEYLFPAREKRFYIEKNNPQDFAARDFDDATKADDNLTFLEQEAINRIYLLALSTKVQPGLIIHWISKLCHQGRRWGWVLGSDLWFQGKDKLCGINIPICKQPTTTCARIDWQKAEPFSAYRLRLFGGLTYKIERPNSNWFISLNSDGSPLRSGIGRDFSVSFKIERQF